MSHHIMNTFFNLKNTKKTLKQQIWQTLHFIYIYIYIYFPPTLAMHLHIILVGNQLHAQFLLWYIYLNPLLFRSRWNLTCVPDGHRQRVIIPEAVLIQLSSWRWAQSCSKHVEDSNKHIIEEIVRQVGYQPELHTILH
jgi:hypothetical protein